MVVVQVVAALFEYYIVKLSFVFAVDGSSNDQSSDLARTSADLVQLGVSQEPPGGVVVDVAVAAQDLDGVQCHLCGL